MYYEDQARRFNLLSGFLFGTLVGAGLALLAGPIGNIELPPRRRVSRRAALEKRWDAMRGEAGDALREVLRARSGHRGR